MIDQEFKPFALQGYSENLEREKLFDVKKTVIDIKINFDDRTVEGKVELHIRMNGLKQDHLEIDAEDMEIYNVSVRGVPSQFEVLSKRIVVYGDFNPFSEYVVTVTYKAYPSKGAYFFEDDGPQFWTHGESEDNHAWFPCFDYPNTRSQYEIRVTVPPGFHVISNGKLVSKVEGEFVTYVFNEEFRFPAYLVSVVAGKFMKYEQEWNGIKITSYFLPRYSGLAERAFKNTPDMMQFISEKTGVPYPYSKYDQTCVTNFLIGGMENITATTLTDRTLHDEIAHLDYQSENLLCHELAHQWFGDYVTCKDWSHAWLNEGFATYIALLYTERYKGKDDLLAEVENTRDAYLKEFTERYGRPIVERTYKEPEELFDRHLYQKASLFLTSALDALGELNDPSVAGTISQYLKKEYDWQTRAAAVSAISKLYWQDRSLGRFISEALRDEFPAVRSRAAESVKSIQEPKLLSDLRAAYEKEKDGFVRRTMREGLEAKGIPLPQDYTQLKEEVARLKERVERLEATKVKARGR